MGPKRPRFLATRWRMKKRDGGAKRKEREKEKRSGESRISRGKWKRATTSRASREGRWRARRVEKDDVRLDDTRHRRIKLTLSKYTIIFVTRARNVKCGIPWRAAIATLFLVNSEARLFIASLRLHQSGSTMCGAAIKFRTFGGNRAFLSPWYVTIPPRNTQNCAQKLVQFRCSSWVTEEKL